jgi:tetratricopeptide (TPR) repeat protein
MTPPPAERLSQTPSPKSPRASPQPEATAQLAVGEIAGRPVGEAKHPPGYDPRDAANVRGAAEKFLVEGAALLQQGRFERARKLFRKALDKDPQRAEAYNAMGVTYYARGDYDEALAWYKKSLEADPRFGDAYYNLACVYALQERADLAFLYLRMAALNHYSGRALMEKDPDLSSLRGEPQWAAILDQMSAEQKPRP